MRKLTGHRIRCRSARSRAVLPVELLRHYAVRMMRPEERYWVKVSLTIGVVVLVLLMLLISGVIGSMTHIVMDILEAER